MWFEPGDLSKNENQTPCDFCDIATLEPENTETAAKSRKVAEVAAPFDSEINIDHQKILNWLASIGEDDQGMIDETIDRCKADPEALSYFLQRADGIAPPL